MGLLVFIGYQVVYIFYFVRVLLPTGFFDSHIVEFC